MLEKGWGGSPSLAGEKMSGYLGVEMKPRHAVRTAGSLGNEESYLQDHCSEGGLRRSRVEPEEKAV